MGGGGGGGERERLRERERCLCINASQRVPISSSHFVFVSAGKVTREG